ncbi:Dual specificity protein kinase TTK [Stylophora pistillata]|uniref:Dual specificity protein kinase TTK n=1 Tax=Stylophora pistillata TaxID=50429 RepID=A0A2B4SCD8_STYPI|nr:Dual specificity protein kinase TTK [Stylophora pistillata]
MLNNSCSTQQGEVSNSGRQPMLYQIPTPQGLPSASSQVIDGSVTIRKQSTTSTAQPAERNGSLLQKKTAQVSHSGPLHSTPGQLLGARCAPGYPQEMQFSRSAAVPAQSSQETIRVKGKLYQRLGTIGKGGSSKVFQGFDGKRICAIKCVNLEEADEFIVRSYINEVQLLERLQGNDNIIKLFDWELSQEMSSLILMLEAVHVIHEARIIHRDLKPANFLLVEGRLKLIDFGIANSLQGDKTSVELETQVGTLNFMSPDAFQDISHAPRFDSAGNAKPRMKIGRASDVWSLGCILHMMVYGRTPFQHITNHIFKLQCMMDPSHVIEFPEIKDKNLLDVMKGCLLRNPKERYTIPQLLAHPYINPPSHDPPVEIEDEDKMFHVLMEFAKADVNSPRSVRALSKTFYKQLLTGKKVSLSSAAPQASIPMHSQSPRQERQIPPRQVLEPVIRQPLVGIDVKALNQAQKALKPPHASGNAKYMKENDREQDKENPDLDGLLKHELLEKYKNAHPRNTSEFSFEQTWNTTYED